MKTESTPSSASRVSSTARVSTHPSPLIDTDDYPQGLLVKILLYHPSLFKIEHDFPNVIYIQDVLHNHFFASKNLPLDPGSALTPVPNFIKNWWEILLVPPIQKSIHKICTILQIPDADAKVDLITGVLGQGVTF